MVLSNFAKRGSMDVIKCLVKLIAATMRRVTRPLVKVMKTSETPSGTVKNCSSTNAMTRRATVTLILWQLFLCFRLFFFLLTVLVREVPSFLGRLSRRQRKRDISPGWQSIRDYPSKVNLQDSFLKSCSYLHLVEVKAFDFSRCLRQTADFLSTRPLGKEMGESDCDG